MEPTVEELTEQHTNKLIRLAFLDIMDGVSAQAIQELTGLPICRCEDIKELQISLIRKINLTKS